VKLCNFNFSFRANPGASFVSITSTRPRSIEYIDYAPWLAYLALGLAFVVIRPDASPVTDVSWLITICERVLAGKRLYVDILETNPPASIWLYLPAVALAMATGVKAELVVNVQFYLLTFCALGLSARIAETTRLFNRENAWLPICSSLAVCLIMPRDTFGQREHAGALLLLPILSCLHLRTVKLSPTLQQIIASGVMAGLALAIKPTFALPLGAAVVAALAWTRAPKLLLSPELWISAAVGGLYVAAVYRFTPEFVTDILPIVQFTYLPARNPLYSLTSLGLVTWFLATLFIWRDIIKNPAIALVFAASVGAMAGMLVQGKGWPYHGLPFVIFILLAQVIALVAATASSQRAFQAAGFAASLFAAMAWLGPDKDIASLRTAVSSIHPKPTLLEIGTIGAVGHPLVREVNGTWVGRLGANWVYLTAELRMTTENLDEPTKAEMNRLIDRELDVIAEDIVQQRPDIVLIQLVGRLPDLVEKAPQLKAALSSYRDRGTVMDVRIMHRE
jgi:hypothetical protein